MSVLHMIELSPDLPALFRFLKNHGLYRHGIEEDLGYATHAWLKAAFQESAPKPFRLLVNRDRHCRILGYGKVDANVLADRLNVFADPSAFRVCAPHDIVSRRMPHGWAQGKKLGFQVLCCPVVRRDGIEKDAFLARADHAGKDAGLERAKVYKEWLIEHMAESVDVLSVGLNSFDLKRHFRQTQLRNRERKSRRLIRPRVEFNGVLAIRNADSFNALLARGIGRHRAFGYGMLLLRPV